MRKTFRFKFLLATMALAATQLIAVGVTASPASAAACVDNSYRQGSSGTCVRNLQRIINAAFMNTPNSTMLLDDGGFGAKTVTGVKAFQRSRGLVADGWVGPKTWQKLCAVTTSGSEQARSSAGCSVKSAAMTCSPSGPIYVDRGAAFTARATYRNRSGRTWVNSNTNPVVQIKPGKSSGGSMGEATPNNPSYTVANGSTVALSFSRGTSSLTSGKVYALHFRIYSASGGNTTGSMTGGCLTTLYVR